MPAVPYLAAGRRKICPHRPPHTIASQEPGWQVLPHAASSFCRTRCYYGPLWKVTILPQDRTDISNIREWKRYMKMILNKNNQRTWQRHPSNTGFVSKTLGLRSLLWAIDKLAFIYTNLKFINNRYSNCITFLRSHINH